MTKEEFYQIQKEEIQQEYKEIKSKKPFKRDAALLVLSKKHGFSTFTIKQIISNSNYRKGIAKKQKNVKTMPK